MTRLENFLLNMLETAHTRTGRTRTLHYTRDRDAADYRLCEPGEQSMLEFDQEEWTDGTHTYWVYRGRQHDRP
jgi:hypothetical protein